MEEVKEIWPRFTPKENVYTVVREFNMPKMNVFPVIMLNNPKRAICMFVKKMRLRKIKSDFDFCWLHFGSKNFGRGIQKCKMR